MSGAEAIAGLAIGAVGLTALFTTCIDAFHIVLSAHEFGEDYEVLCADLAIQRLRFCLWGETVGLVSRGSLTPPNPLPALGDPVIKPTVIQALQAIQYLLQEANRVRDQFSSTPRSSRQLTLFRDTFNQFSLRANLSRKRASVATVTKWAVYAREKFQERIERLKSLIDGLEKVSESLGVLELQRRKMQIEIESLDDADSLRLVRDASAYSQQGLSDTASQRLLVLETASSMGQVSLNDSPSFYTARETQCIGTSLDPPDRPSTPSVASRRTDSRMTQNSRIMANIGNIAAHPRIWTAGPKTTTYGAKLGAFDIENMACFGNFPTSLSYIPVILKDLAEVGTVGSEDVAMGYTKLRILKEIKEIANQENTPWIKLSPLCSDISHLLAGIEGPPDTPYEGGVFWIYVQYSEYYPNSPPKLRFLTRIYHPNIDSRGYICLDLLEDRWTPGLTIFSALVSVSSLLDDPGLTDPLVPEIAEIYCKNYDLYSQNARTYTARYAMAEPTDTVFNAGGWQLGNAEFTRMRWLRAVNGDIQRLRRSNDRQRGRRSTVTGMRESSLGHRRGAEFREQEARLDKSVSRKWFN